MHVSIRIDTEVTPAEVVALRRANGWDGVEQEWEQCLTSAMCVVTARSDGALVGIGLITGTVRHAELVDLVVDSEFQRQGVARQIVDRLNEFAKETGIRYYGLTFDKTYPWLKDFYASEGFTEIDFAMWHKQSLT